MVRIKICGITHMDDALMAVHLGADALGFIFASSPRRITPECARLIVNGLPPFVQTVGVFVNESRAIIRDTMAFCGLDMIQLHGDESPEFCKGLGSVPIKSFRIKDAESLTPMGRYQGKVRAVLLDTFQSNKPGGTGKAFDWGLALKAKAFDMPLILSGGLGPSNIERAVAVVTPYAVDVNSGIETAPGKKSAVLMEELMNKLKSVRKGGVVHG
ncbi:MAG: phosphoribosylanthranilate isomerase [Deltaproteobacteria bacterium]